MTNDLKDLLRSVLKEELEPINKRLDGIEKAMNDRFNIIERDINELKVGQEQLQKNIIAYLGEYTEKIAEHIDHVDNKTEVLNKRLSKAETDVHLLTR